MIGEKSGAHQYKLQGSVVEGGVMDGSATLTVFDPYVDADMKKLEQSDSKYARYLCKILGLYFNYHKDAYFTKGVYLHDPATIVAAVNPSLMTYTEGVVRVQTVGITRGLTVFDNTKKRFGQYTIAAGLVNTK
ncbi:hypothetical protein GUJ93_ZPchr0010g7244 [Zizania palustris]|uniref:Inosine/uridine-preferring nucleoside hydrolase domain-containing protein n=1 Tax=Zizania palustris TaxID=103762 RepID=A0A8J5WGN9_ZIZPA|nr:hypothetical protein GUJ93_ZPchr0010g7244 [Zizania palustris]